MSICQTLYAASCPPTSFVHNTQIHTDTHTYTHSHALAQVVRDYNKILTTLDREERMLFNDRIRHLSHTMYTRSHAHTHLRRWCMTITRS